MPVWLLLLVLVLASYRITRLVVRDEFPPVLAVRDKLAGGWRPLTQQETDQYAASVASGHGSLGWDQVTVDGKRTRHLVRASWSPYWLAELVSCGWCASGWVSGALTAATDVAVGVPDPWLAGPAVWAGAALLTTRSWA